MTMQRLFLLFLLPYASLSFTLITFDVDGTLIQGSGQAAEASAHARAFGHAVGTVLGDGRPVTSVAQALPQRLYHGSTDGLILLRLARATLGIEPDKSFQRLDDMMACMYNFINDLDDGEISEYLSPLPGVIGHLTTLATMQDHVLCGLVTGNVEGVARRKMKAVGILGTGALSPPCVSQKEWKGTEELAFLGGFGSDYCSGNIDDLERNHLDRGQQIAIAAQRCRNRLGDDIVLKRVVHVGDAPADVLAAKYFCDTTKDNVCVGMVAVATGSYSAQELRDLAGDPVPGKWEPVVLEKGMADSNFLSACGL
jgi:phosphoglycolate phosphatase-like HAD superfamily hydrolase